MHTIKKIYNKVAHAIHVLCKATEAVWNFKRTMSLFRYRKIMTTYNSDQSKEFIDTAHAIALDLVKKYHTLWQGDILNEFFFISFFVKGQKEADENAYNSWIRELTAEAFQTGRSNIKQELPMWNNDRTRIAFIGLGDDPSAYTHIFYLCQYLTTHNLCSPHIFLFSYYEKLENISKRFSSISVPVILIPFHESNISNASAVMAVALQKQKIDIAIWVHLPTIMFNLFGMRVAPIQVFFSQYLHPDVEGMGIDSLLTYGGISQKDEAFLNLTWNIIPSALQISNKTFDNIDAYRKLYAEENQIIISTFGRSDKVSQGKFLDSIVQILRCVKNAVFLYTGYVADKSIQDFFDRHGLAERVRFIGWVEIEKYVQITDLVLDSFPLANGITALTAMRYKTPVLSMANMYSYMGRDIYRAATAQEFSGYASCESVFYDLKAKVESLKFQPYAHTCDEYISIAISLLNNKERRDELAEFQEFCINRLYTNVEMMGKAFYDYILSLHKTL